MQFESTRTCGKVWPSTNIAMRHGPTKVARIIGIDDQRRGTKQLHRPTVISISPIGVVQFRRRRPQYRPSSADHSKGARQPLLSLKCRTAGSAIASEIRMARTQHTV